jgi:uncharacterized OsmC-like protein
VKITILGDDAILLEGPPGALSIEAESADIIYSPFHMLASGLASCTYGVLSSWANTAKLNFLDLKIEVRWSFAEKPHRVGAMTLSFDWKSLPPERTEAAKRAAALCPIHHTLKLPTEVTIERTST